MSVLSVQITVCHYLIPPYRTRGETIAQCHWRTMRRFSPRDNRYRVSHTTIKAASAYGRYPAGARYKSFSNIIDVTGCIMFGCIPTLWIGQCTVSAYSVVGKSEHARYCSRQGHRSAGPLRLPAGRVWGVWATRKPYMARVRGAVSVSAPSMSILCPISC